MVGNPRRREGRSRLPPAKARSSLALETHFKPRVPDPNLQAPNEFQCQKIQPLPVLGFGAWDFAALAAASSPALRFWPPARMKSILQIARVRGIHPKAGALDVFHRAHVNLVGKDVTEGNQSSQF